MQKKKFLLCVTDPRSIEYIKKRKADGFSHNEIIRDLVANNKPAHERVIDSLMAVDQVIDECPLNQKYVPNLKVMTAITRRFFECAFKHPELFDDILLHMKDAIIELEKNYDLTSEPISPEISDESHEVRLCSFCKFSSYVHDECPKCLDMGISRKMNRIPGIYDMSEYAKRYPQKNPVLSHVKELYDKHRGRYITDTAYEKGLDQYVALFGLPWVEQAVDDCERGV